MVGFLGKQFTLSGDGLGANAEEHSTITLKDGTIITGYFTSNSGPMSLYSFDPRTKITTNLGGYGDFSTDFSDPYLLASDNGGFKIVYNTKSTTGGLFYRQYDKSGALVGAEKTLVTGWIDSARSYETKNGFFVSYRDRTHEIGEPEYIGSIYNEAGQLVLSFDLAEGKTFGGFAHPEPQALVLSNGNLAVVWQKSNLDGTVVQIFKPNGSKVGGEKQLDNIPLTIHPEVIEAHPDGGFVVAHAPLKPINGGQFTVGDIVIQRYSNSGKKTGPEITFDTDVDGSKISSGTNFDVAFTKEGLIAIAWTGGRVNNWDDEDVYFAVLTASGKLVVGPQVADITPGDNQLDVQFNTLKNGDLFLTFKDDATLQFHYVASIQGRFITDPDLIWEGDANANTHGGSIGDDVLLGFGGADTLSGGKGEDFIRGGKGADVLSGGARLDVLHGEEGNDDLSGDSGNDTLYGGAGKDVLRGGSGKDDLFGGDDADTLRGGKGADNLYGDAGGDKLFGDGGDDRMYGGDGNDRMEGSSGNDQMFGEAGNDTLKGGVGNDNLVGGDGKDKLFGGDGFDILRGGIGNDVLRGGNGNDTLTGDDGNDKMYGDAGDDTFHDNAGNDIMFGGTGADTFRFFAADFGRDRIKDFEVGTDKLDMSVLANGLALTGGSIKARDVASGVKFSVDSDNWVIVENLTLAELTAGVDYLI